MQCPECGYRVMLVYKSSNSNSSVKRTRECPKCFNREKTEEVFVDQKDDMAERLLILEKQVSHMTKTNQN